MSRKGRELPQKRAARGLGAWSLKGNFDDLAFLVAQLVKNLPAVQETPV